MNSHSKSELRSGAQLRDKVRGLVRDELLQAAERVFAEEGLQTAKVENIAARAGVSVGTVYNYFADRKALVDAVMEYRREELFKRLQQLDQQTEGQAFLQRLDVSIETLLDYFQAQRPYFLLMVQAEGSLAFKQALSSVYDPCQGPWGSIYSHMESLVRQGIREGVLRLEDLRLLTVFLFGTCKAMGLFGLPEGVGVGLPNRKAIILRFFLQGAGLTAPAAA